RLPSASASSTKAMPSSARPLTIDAPLGPGHPLLPARQEHAHDEADAERREDRGQGTFPHLMLDLLERLLAGLARPLGDLLGAVADLLRQVLGLLRDLLAGLRGGFLGCVHDRLYPFPRRAGAALRERRDVAAQGGEVLL